MYTDKSVALEVKHRELITLLQSVNKVAGFGTHGRRPKSETGVKMVPKRICVLLF